MKSYFIVIAVFMLVAGCATNKNNNVWVKDGSSTNEFETDKYDCMQQSQQHQGAAFLNSAGGVATNGQITNWNLYNSCMSSRGWSLQNKDAYQAALVQKQAEFEKKKIEVQPVLKGFNDRRKALCEKQELAQLFLKTPCLPNDINFEQLADSTKITSEQKIALIIYRTEVDASGKEQFNYLRQIGTDADRRWIDFQESQKHEIDKYNLDLFKGEITWGEYNQRRKDSSEKGLAEYKRIYNQNH